MKQLSVLTKTYLLFINVTGLVILISNLRNGIKVENPGFLAILALLGGILHVLKVEGPTTRSHFTISFIVFGFTIALSRNLDILIVILAANLFQWILNPPPAWYIQPYNIGSYLISAQFASFIYTSINPLGDLSSPATIIAIIASAAGFTLINHFMLGIILWLARGENFKRSGVFDVTPVLIDLTMLSLGASLAIVWVYNPYALFLFLVPLYPFYKTLKIPSLERKTETDQKTGLFNHAYFMAQLKHELQRAVRYDRPLAIIMADLDLLRNINNTYGHLAGDEVLKGIADVLKQSVREYDTVARFGGEEFAILMPETKIENAVGRAEFIRKAVESASFTIPTSIEPIKITMSFGVAIRENFEQTCEEIVHNADTALYNSKLKGRNMVFTHLNDSFISAQDGFPQSQSEDIANYQVSLQKDLSTPQYLASTAQYSAPMREHNEIPHEHAKHPSDTKLPAKSNSSKNKVYAYITLLTAAACLISEVVYFLFPEAYTLSAGANWYGLAVICSIIILTEWFSIDLYIGNTSLSTSAVPLIAGFLIFGAIGAITGSLAFAIVAAIKYRSPINRLVFNLSNHILASMLIIFMLALAGILHQKTGMILQILITLAATMVFYFVTTSLIAAGMGLDLNQSPRQIWKEQYSWMAPFYVGIGFIAYSLIFGYAYAGLLGIFLMIVPLLILRFSQKQYVEHTRKIVNQLKEKNQAIEKTSQEIFELNNGLLETISEIVAIRDPYVLGHSKQVSEYATEIAKALGVNKKQIELINKAGLLHDIGKLGIPTEILAKPAKLTPEEYEVIKKHPALGADLVEKTPSLKPLVPVIRHHHEFFDGNGYPDKLKGNQISIEARIMAVADAIDAMTSDRPYRKAMEHQKAIKELRKYAGSQFDPTVVDAAVRILERKIQIEEKETINTHQPVPKFLTDSQTI